MDGYSDASFLSHDKSSRAGMTRRDVLRALAAGSTALAGAPLLSMFGIADAWSRQRQRVRSVRPSM